MDRRRFLASGVAVAGLAPLAVRPAAAQQTFTMKVASATINDVQHEFQKRFKDRLEARSGGRIRVEVYPASQLGPIPSMVDGVTLGTIECFVTATAFLSQIDPRFQVFDLPGLFPDPDRTRRVLRDAETRRRIDAFGAARGIQPVAWFLHSPNAILAKRPVRSIEDLRGLKVRVLSSPLQMEPVRRAGATPVPMPLSEVMPALQTGAIDGFVAGSTVFAAFRYFDVAKPLTIIPSWPVITTAVVNRRWLDRLPADLKAMVTEEAAAAEQEASAWGAEDLARSEAAWTQGGGEIIRMAPAAETALKEAFVASTEPLVAASAPLRAEADALRGAIARLGAG